VSEETKKRFMEYRTVNANTHAALGVEKPADFEHPTYEYNAKGSYNAMFRFGADFWITGRLHIAEKK